jgi:hypothetical protein
LQTKYIYRLPLKPIADDRQPRAHGVDIPSRYLHLIPAETLPNYYISSPSSIHSRLVSSPSMSITVIKK